MNEPCKQAVELQVYFGLSASTAYTAILKAMKSYAAEQNADLLCTQEALLEQLQDRDKLVAEANKAVDSQHEQLSEREEAMKRIGGYCQVRHNEFIEESVQRVCQQNADLRTELETIRKGAEIYKSMADDENAELERKAAAWEKDFRVIKSAHDLKQVTLEEYGEEIDELRRQVAEKDSKWRTAKDDYEHILTACGKLEDQLSARDRAIAKNERAILAVIDERAAAQQALSQAYYLTFGESAEWSNLFGVEHATEAIGDAVNLLKQTVAELTKDKESWYQCPQCHKTSNYIGPIPPVCYSCGTTMTARKDQP